VRAAAMAALAATAGGGGLGCTASVVQPQHLEVLSPGTPGRLLPTAGLEVRVSHCVVTRMSLRKSPGGFHSVLRVPYVLNVCLFQPWCDFASIGMLDVQIHCSRMMFGSPVFQKCRLARSFQTQLALFAHLG
jgi:hypothetical protein